MAKISHSDAAPDEVVTYSLCGVEFKLGGDSGDSYETDDRDVLGNASGHPWLQVEWSTTVSEPNWADTGLPSSEDSLSSENDHSNDADAVAADWDAGKVEYPEVPGEVIVQDTPGEVPPPEPKTRAKRATADSATTTDAVAETPADTTDTKDEG